jgi:hypothetical protein
VGDWDFLSDARAAISVRLETVLESLLRRSWPRCRWSKIHPAKKPDPLAADTFSLEWVFGTNENLCGLGLALRRHAAGAHDGAPDAPG